MQISIITLKCNKTFWYDMNQNHLNFWWSDINFWIRKVFLSLKSLGGRASMSKRSISRFSKACWKLLVNDQKCLSVWTHYGTKGYYYSNRVFYLTCQKTKFGKLMDQTSPFFVNQILSEGRSIGEVLIKKYIVSNYSS